MKPNLLSKSNLARAEYVLPWVSAAGKHGVPTALAQRFFTMIDFFFFFFCKRFFCSCITGQGRSGATRSCRPQRYPAASVDRQLAGRHRKCVARAFQQHSKRRHFFVLVLDAFTTTARLSPFRAQVDGVEPPFSRLLSVFFASLCSSPFPGTCVPFFPPARRQSRSQAWHLWEAKGQHVGRKASSQRHLRGAVSAANWRSPASGTSFSAAGNGGIVQNVARWTATAKALHQRLAQPCEAAVRNVARARRARIATRRCTKRWDSSFQRPPTSAARTHRRWGPSRVSSG